MEALQQTPWGFLGGANGLKKNPLSNAGDVGLIPGLGRSLGEGNGNPLQYSCLENPMDGRAWWATVHGVAELDMTEDVHRHLMVQNAQSVSSVTQSCPTLCDPMDCSMPDVPVHHQLLELTQTHVH